MRTRRGTGARTPDDPGERRIVHNYRNIAVEDDIRRREQHEGIKPRPEQVGLTDTERLVHSILDEEFVSAKELAGFAGISVHECRRALATLRSLGLADAQRRGQVNAWRRA